MSKYLIIIKAIFLITLAGCANSQQQSNSDKMKVVATKLYKCLTENDSTCIANLFDNKWKLDGRKYEIKKDCNLVSTLAVKYGIPAIEDFIIEKADDGTNLVSINLFEKPDTSLNFKKAQLVIYFFSDEQMDKVDKFFTYYVFKEYLKKPEKKIIQASEIIIE